MKSKQKRLKQTEGVVLVIALFIVALVTSIAYYMIARLERDMRRTTLLLRNAQAELYAQGSLAWAIDQLHNDWVKQKNNKVIDQTPIESPENEVNGYKIKSVIYDMQARFNINNLTQNESVQDFKRLIQVIDPDLSSTDTDQLSKNVINWIAPKNQNEAIDRYYLKLKKPYRNANRQMMSISELRLVKGMTGTLYQKLLPYLCALPEITPINIETATPEILATLSDTMTLDSGKALIDLRKQKPFVSLDVVKDLDLIKNHSISEKKITVYSQYFLVETRVSMDKECLIIYTLLARSTNDTKATINLVWQSKGVW